MKGTATIEGDVVITAGKDLTVDGTLYSTNINSGTDLTVNGHVEISGSVTVTGTVAVYSASSLLVDGALSCATLTVGATGKPGRVEADTVSATTAVTVSEAGSSLTVVGTVAGNVTVKDAAFTSNGVTGNLTVEGPASVSAGEVTGTVNTDKAEGDDIVYTVKETNSATTDSQSVYGA